jgi:glycosyltransferase involved in cell wall biosynthesis
VSAKAMPTEDLRDLGLDPDRFLVLYAGIMNPPQGLDVLLDAARLLQTEAPHLAGRVQIALVGGGSEQAALAARARADGFADLVRFVPVQMRERIPALLKAAGAIVVPLRPRNDSHTVPSKLYEAMASGRPVLVSADGAPRQIVEAAEAGLATPAADAAGLVGSLRTLLERPELASRFGAHGAAYAQRFNRRELVSQLEELLQSVVRRAPP